MRSNEIILLNMSDNFLRNCVNYFNYKSKAGIHLPCHDFIYAIIDQFKLNKDNSHLNENELYDLVENSIYKEAAIRWGDGFLKK